MTDKRLGEILVEQGSINMNQLLVALGYQFQLGQSLGRTCVALDFCGEDDIASALSLQCGVPRVELAELDLDASVLDLIPGKLAHEVGAIPIKTVQDGTRKKLFVAMSTPKDLNAVETLEFAAGMTVLPRVVGDTDLRAALTRFYPADTPKTA